MPDHRFVHGGKEMPKRVATADISKNHIKTRKMDLILPEPLTEQPLCAISIDRSWQGALGHYQAEARIAEIVGTHLPEHRPASPRPTNGNDSADRARSEALRSGEPC